MFLGIFSSILPYIIAAGFYLLWMLFSFAQPAIQKVFSQKDAPTKQNVLYSEEDNTVTDSCFFYEDFNSDSDRNNNQQDISYSSVEYNILQDISFNWPPGVYKSYINTFYLDAHFCRPPPAC